MLCSLNSRISHWVMWLTPFLSVQLCQYVRIWESAEKAPFNATANSSGQGRGSSTLSQEMSWRFLGPALGDGRVPLDQVLPLELGPESLRNRGLHRGGVRERLRFGMRSDDQ
jgi:hypothetical protein